MAASPLAQIDWTNLQSADLPLAIKLLATATQERFNIATVDRDGGMRSVVTIGTLSLTDRRRFPYKTNTPLISMNEGDPIFDFTFTVGDLLDKMIRLYADIEKWDTADTDSEGNADTYTLYGDADDPGTYDNRLFEITGYTSYPDLSVYAAVEVKKWYDMLVVLKYIFRQSGLRGDDYLIYNGVFDVEAEAFFSSNIDGAEYFVSQVNPQDNPETPIADSTVYDAFEDANVALFGTLPDQFDESTDTGTTPPEPFESESGDGSTIYNLLASRSSDEYVSWLRAWETTYVADWTDSIAAVGFTGKPLSYKNQIRAVFTASSSVPSFTPVITYPESTTADFERYYTSNVVTRVGDIDKIAVDQKLTPITVPTSLSAFTGNNQEVLADITLQGSSDTLEFSDFQFLEDWNGEGGFEYYTP